MSETAVIYYESADKYETGITDGNIVLWENESFRNDWAETKAKQLYNKRKTWPAVN